MLPFNKRFILEVAKSVVPRDAELTFSFDSELNTEILVLTYGDKSTSFPLTDDLSLGEILFKLTQSVIEVS